MLQPTRFGVCPLPVELTQEKVQSYRQPLSPKDRKDVKFFREKNETGIKSSKTISSALRHFLLLRKPMIIHIETQALLLCFGCGHYLDVGLFDVDHVQSSRWIIERQRAFIDRMNHDPEFAINALKDPRARDFVHLVAKETGFVYKGTKLFYRMYHNALHNLWLLCKKCNGGSSKHDGDFMEWFHGVEFFGPSFVDSLKPLDYSGIIITSKDGVGIGEAARSWFLTHHRPFMLRERQIKMIHLLFHKDNIRVFELEIQDDGHDGESTQLQAKRLNLNTRIQLVQLLLNEGDENAKNNSK
ncbi:hypothetical protein DID73_00285 [Candidatus Marinamargulisbacteria bacterium SCGC AG-343-K17]|nr:hypothetical protein DID73_00285 [Candidatus Marinamargulisbacteria bacterium SCGC AG-343-K17]